MLESEVEKKRDKVKENDLDAAAKETEILNARARLKDEKKEFEVQEKERLMREI